MLAMKPVASDDSPENQPLLLLELLGGGVFERPPFLPSWCLGLAFPLSLAGPLLASTAALVDALASISLASAVAAAGGALSCAGNAPRGPASPDKSSCGFWKRPPESDEAEDDDSGGVAIGAIIAGAVAPLFDPGP